MARKRIGTKLRSIRLQGKLSLRDVATRSVRIAQEWGSWDYRISPSWLARVEREKHELTIPKLIVLAAIYNLPPEELLRLCLPTEELLPKSDQSSSSSRPAFPKKNSPAGRISDRRTSSAQSIRRARAASPRECMVRSRDPD
jgi:transcriptional regulator with XRE-family HTH domain